MVEWSLWVSVCAVCGRCPPPLCRDCGLTAHGPRQKHTHSHTETEFCVDAFYRIAMNFLAWKATVTKIEKCVALVRGLLCISAHYSVCGGFTLLSDLMAVSLLSNNTDPDWASSCYLCFLLWWLVCVCVSLLYAHIYESVCVCAACKEPVFEPAVVSCHWYSWSSIILPHWSSSGCSWLVCMRGEGCDEEEK